MTDVSDRRREPKGIPTGGEFAGEGSGVADASDLKPSDSRKALHALCERERREYLASLSDGELERQAAEEDAYHGGVPEPKEGFAEAKGPTTKTEPKGKPDGKAGPGRDADLKVHESTAEQFGREVAKPKKKSEGKAEKETEPPKPNPARDRLWTALAARKTDRETRARLARDPRLLAVAGSEGNARPVAVMGSWGRSLEWLGSDGRMHASPLSKGMCVDMGGSSYAEYRGYSDRLGALRGHMSDVARNALGNEFGRLRKRRVEAEAGLVGWTAADDAAERKVREALAAAEKKAWPEKTDSKAGKGGGRPDGRSASGHPAPRHLRLVRFMSAAGRAGAVVVGGFLSAVRRLLAPLGRR